MVARVLQLRLALFLGTLRGSAWHVIRQVAGLVVIGALVMSACVGALSLDDDHLDVASAVLTLVGAALLIGFAVGPFLAGATDQLDPRRFSVLGAEPTPLAGTLLLGSLISVPSVALLAIDVSTAVVWVRLGVPALVAVVSALLHVVTCVVLARIAMGLASTLMRGRRTRELSSLFVLGVIVVVFPVAVFLSSLEWDGRVPEQIRLVVEILALTPFGAAAGAPGAIAMGSGFVSWWASIVGVLAAGLVVWFWFWFVRHLLSTVENPVEVRQRGGLGWFALTPGVAAGAIAARSIIYWFSDMRYMANLVIIPIAGLLPIVPLLIAGVPAEITALVPVPIMALFFGWVAHNDTAYDSSAVWLHIVTGVSGISDRLGRTVPVLLTAVPVLAVTIPVSVALYGRWALLPGMVGVAASLFLCGLGLSCISSAVAPYAVPTPGDGPFQQPQRSGSVGVWSQALVMGIALVASGPTLWFMWLALTDDIANAMTAQWVGVGTGLSMLALGVVAGGLLFQHRESRIMEFAGTT
ncbi:hypothetical protein [Microbacterium sp. JB110]|uniref:hypothetical protein n=1 Tax=Microbacterium sp. JB110 TaxID=2024477 RepID=UPI00097F051B|nr:hypothetical protein [Microbacterium sp. JB110]RCS62032.1 hypothetical protein CIK77_04850 [Microbacterium sp. JB110]SJM44156.1 putative integral membrane transport protein [Frigoribacterium sp. JB110]